MGINFSIVIACKQFDTDLSETLASIAGQNLDLVSRIRVVLQIKSYARCSTSRKIRADAKKILLGRGVELIELNKNDSGVYSALNIALEEILKDSYVLVLGQGDKLSDSGVLKKISYSIEKGIEEGKRPLLVSGHLEFIKNGEAVRFWRVRAYQSVFEFQVRALPHLSTFIHSDIYSLYGHYDESFQIAGDYEFFLRLSKTRDILASIVFADVDVSAATLGGLSTSWTSALVIAREDLRALRKHNVPAWTLLIKKLVKVSQIRVPKLL